MDFKRGIEIMVLLTILSTSGLALKCYVCNTAYDPNCDSKSPPEKYLVECTDSTAKPIPHTPEGNATNLTEIVPGNGTYPFCRKEQAGIPEQVNGKDKKDALTRIIRSCGWLGDHESDVCKVVSPEGVILEHCVCLKDGCNFGHRDKPWPIIVSGVAITILILPFMTTQD